MRRLSFLAALCVAAVLVMAPAATARDDDIVGAWAASPQPPYSFGVSNEGFADQTVRNVVRPSVGGSRLRIEVSNEFGEKPLSVGAASVAVRGSGASTVPGTDVGLTFNGRPSVKIPAGGEVRSDPAAFRFAPGEDLAVSLYLRGETGPTTWHELGQRLNYVSNPGDHTANTKDTAFAFGYTSYFFLTAVDAVGAGETGTIVAVGDSITDGYGSTLNADARYPDYLSRRVLKAGVGKSVVNAGISGNRILNDAPCCGERLLDRFERDVLGKPGVTDVILLEGINDIGFSELEDDPTTAPHEEVSADEIIAGMREVIDRAHARGVEIYGGTLTPFEGADYYYETGEEKRQAVNDFVRNSGEFDGVVDFDAALRDPADPKRLLPAYDSGDHLHPNDAGYRAMAKAVDLTLFGRQAASQRAATRTPDTGGAPLLLLPVAALLLGFGVLGLVVRVSQNRRDEA